VPVRTVAVFGPRASRLDLELPGPTGFCVTRKALEGHLAERARAKGAALLERAPVRELAPARDGWRYIAGSEEGSAQHLLCAFGKRSTLDAAMALPRASAPETFAAAKAYFDAPRRLLEADVELFVLRRGYVGLNPVEGGRLALCALLGDGPTSDWERLRERFAENPALAGRLDRLGAPSGPVRGLARFGFGFQKLSARDRRTGQVALFAGDCARMMPSFTGDGMAVALRSGRLAARALDAGDPAETYAALYAREFAARFRAGQLLHGALLKPWIFGFAAPILGRSPRVVERLVAWTRGA
jgi:menaquinone-9 beta-reductase